MKKYQKAEEIIGPGPRFHAAGTFMIYTDVLRQKGIRPVRSPLDS